jgi:hypothetical protein
MTNSKYALGRCPFEVMDRVSDRPWDTYGPNFSWGEFGYLKRDLEQVVEELHNQRDELLDQITALQNELHKRGIPLPPVKGV